MRTVQHTAPLRFLAWQNSSIDLETFEETPVFLKSQQKTNMTAAKNGVTDKNEWAKWLITLFV